MLSHLRTKPSCVNHYPPRLSDLKDDDRVLRFKKKFVFVWSSLTSGTSWTQHLSHITQKVIHRYTVVDTTIQCYLHYTKFHSANTLPECRNVFKTLNFHKRQFKMLPRRSELHQAFLRLEMYHNF